jgi:hypothetical protein
MTGGRALTEDEVARVSQRVYGTPMSERLALRVGDVWQHGGLVERVAAARKAMKWDT